MWYRAPNLKEGLIIATLFTLALVLFAFVLQFGGYNLGKEHHNTRFGVTFSIQRARELRLDWRRAYLAVLDDLGVKVIRIPFYWNDIEKQEGEYDFEDYHWMVGEAQKRGVQLIPVIGMRVPRWPECHIPQWIKVKLGTQDLKENQDSSVGIRSISEGFPQDQDRVWGINYLQNRILVLIEKEVKEFDGYDNILYWQVENEPLLKRFGMCPFHDKDFYRHEVALVKSLDPNRSVMATDAGELSTWIDLAEIGDVFGFSLYRKVFNPYFGFFHYPLPPLFYQKKLELVSGIVKGAILSELQSEPWIDGPIGNVSLQTQVDNFSISRMRDTVLFSKKIGVDRVLLWGVEWWYDMLEDGHPEYWNYAKTLFRETN